MRDGGRIQKIENKKEERGSLKDGDLPMEAFSFRYTYGYLIRFTLYFFAIILP
jgi:hypothetical protein